MSVTQTNLND